MLVLLLSPMTVFGAEFDFYGIKFGNTKEEINKVFSITNVDGTNKAKEPEHKMDDLYFKFDNNNCLYQIEAYYILRSSNEENEALLQAIDEHFVIPLKKQTEIKVITENYTYEGTYGSIKYYILKISSKKQTDDYVRYLKNKIIQEMK